MSIRIGYLLPTRERIMAEQPQAAPLLELAERAERVLTGQGQTMQRQTLAMRL
jgi:hypothetical protein